MHPSRVAAHPLARALIAVASLLSGVGVAAAQTGPRLVCFERAGLTASLDRVTNPQQFLRNDRLLKSGSCDFAAVPSGSTARFAGFHRSPRGFVFPLYNLRYSTTGQRMVAADGIFRDDAWYVTAKCGRGGFGDLCLVPSTCAALDGFVTAGSIPRYVAVPAQCEVLRTQ